MKTAVITTGGLGTRLLTFTKGNPKTMLPLYEKSNDKNPDPLLRPLFEIIFEKLYDLGFRKFCFIIGTKTKQSILNHMKPDQNFIRLLEKRGSDTDIRFVKNLNRIYYKINNCKIFWISQSTPMGFGHALISASKFVGNDTFLLHAGDTYFPSYDFLPKFILEHKKNSRTSGTILLQKRKNLDGFGIAQVRKQNNKNLVFNVEEKPKKPLSNWAILPIYIFSPKIFEALKKTKKDHNNEIQVTDAIETLIKWNKQILGFDYKNEKWFDVGTPHNYFAAISYSYRNSIKRA